MTLTLAFVHLGTVGNLQEEMSRPFESPAVRDSISLKIGVCDLTEV